MSGARRDRRDLDEDDVRTRPGRGSRPRTRDRPEHADAVDAVVVGVDRGRYTCRLTAADDRPAAPARARPETPEKRSGASWDPSGVLIEAIRGGELRRTPVVVGDRVALVGDVSGRPGALARIVRRAERTSVLRRTADDSDPAERPIVANAEKLIIVAALADPPPRTGLIDRCLVAAYDGGLEPVLCLTKADLADDTALRELYRPLGVTIVTSRPDVDPVELRGLIAGRVSVLFGHSGVGKSTLVNRLVPDAAREIGAVNVVTGRGRHTSSAAVALPVPGGGWVVDTPGIRSFGLGAVSPARVLSAFAELAEAAADCQPGCTHAEGLADCGLDEAVRDGRADPARLASLRRLLAARPG
ncbi:ribosome small subunit-dependent GTPase A [Frankia sp. CNm7]|uniref:Ribosome small subunit-dependent GTPase A n=1 Tax=Frankia nepalensis TaxID=1836974 RepID=A0A937RQR1_9ACTN|nr:ribosome small subunit-dependent GTPase A [Frankia nepalensis]MBL7500744.1 ribosome small subunit-dependent GTPase A [Frankia nepalensis]MBL7511768.1 ribosome small subunit-dependent GTPase A [Frankia nepalensis]MBL7521961.1 ribosome small subunit-dependent GTPase A [Frankia nepalensis]MBL7633184.1 ribosome small subunit-dependent GTPase A [Frankia nepalensis]